MRSKTCYYHTNHLGISDLIFRVSIWKVDDKPDHDGGEQMPSSSMCHVEKTIKWQEKVSFTLVTPTMHDDECYVKHDQEGTRVQFSNQEEIVIFTHVDSDICISDHTVSTSSLKICHRNTNGSGLSCDSNRRGRIMRDVGCESMQILAAVKYDVDCKYDETVLCTLNFNSDGLLVMSPGFSNAHRRMLGDEEDDAIEILSLEGFNRCDEQDNVGLPFYCFKSPHNRSLFRYILECKNLVKEFSELEKMSLRLINAEYDVLSERQKDALSMWKQQSYSFLDDRTREDHILQIEIESVRDFPSVRDIFIKYKIIASNHWTIDNKLELPRKEHDSSSRLIGRKVEDDTEPASYVVIEGHTMTSSQLSTYMVDIRKVYLSFCLFIFIWIIVSFYLGLQLSAVLTLSLLIILDDLFGYEMNSLDSYNKSSIVHVGHFISMYRRSKEKVPDIGALDFEPKLNIKVYRKRTNEVLSLLGETEYLIPVAQGYQEIDLLTTLPRDSMGISGALLHLKEYYLGTTCMGDSGRNIGDESNNYVSTIQSGVVRLRIQNISNFKHFVVPPSLHYLSSSEVWRDTTKERLLSRIPSSFCEDVEVTDHQSTVACTSEEQGQQKSLRRSEKAKKILEGIRKRRETRLTEGERLSALQNG